MTADAKLMEAILRVEHKLDTLLEQLRFPGAEFTKMGSINHICPVCKQNVSYNVDINDAVVLRNCACATGKIALDLKAFAPPAKPAPEKDNGGREDEEDRIDTTRGGRNRRG